MALLHVTQFFVGSVTSVSPTYTTLYTVPAGHRIVLRNIQLHNQDGTTARLFYLKVGGTLVYNPSVSAGGNSAVSLWIVLGPGQTIQTAGSNAAGFGLVVSGSDYTI
jgi:hypothetical protein